MNQKKRKKVKEFLKMKSCRYCRSKENLTIDHKVPITQGGKDDISNLQCLCKRCNGIKSGLSHNQVLHYWRWFETVQREREANGKKPYAFKSKLINKYMAEYNQETGQIELTESDKEALGVDCNDNTMYPITCGKCVGCGTTEKVDRTNNTLCQFCWEQAEGVE